MYVYTSQTSGPVILHSLQINFQILLPTLPINSSPVISAFYSISRTVQAFLLCPISACPIVLAFP